MMQPTKKLKSISILTIILAIVMIIGCFTTACKAADASTKEDLVQAGSADTSCGNSAAEVSSVSNDETVIKKENDTAIFDPKDKVGSEQNALKIVMDHNISGSENFVYDEFMSEEYVLLPYHIIKSEDETDTMYQVYDFNGEFLLVTIDANYTEDAVSISEDEAREKALSYINLLYDDAEVTINSCEISGGNSFNIKGELYKASEQSSREFSLTLNGAGEFAGIMAPYDVAFVLGVSEETKNIVLSYSPDQNVDIELIDVEDVKGDEIYTFYMDSPDSNRVGDQRLMIKASDNSLIEYTSYLGRTDARLTYSDDEISSIALAYIAEYFPELENVSIASIEKAYSECYVSADTSSTDKQISVTIWAGGEIKCIKMMEAVEPVSVGGTVSQEELDATQEAMENGGYEVLIGKEFTFVRKYDKADSETQIVYEYEYVSASPSIRDYSMIVSVIYDKSSDRYYIKINPVLEELDIISEDEAIEKAKQYIGEEKGIDPADFECTYIDLAAGDILAYDISLEYDNHSSSVLIYPDTGEIDTTGELEYEGFRE